MRISDWSSDVCSSDLLRFRQIRDGRRQIVDSRGQAVLLSTQVGAFSGNRVDRRVERRERTRSTRRGREVERIDTKRGGLQLGNNSEEGREGKDRVSTCSSRGTPINKKKRKTKK